MKLTPRQFTVCEVNAFDAYVGDFVLAEIDDKTGYAFGYPVYDFRYVTDEELKLYGIKIGLFHSGLAHLIDTRGGCEIPLNSITAIYETIDYDAARQLKVIHESEKNEANNPKS